MTEKEAKEMLNNNSCYECSWGTYTGASECSCPDCRIADATRLAIKALDAQIKLKEYIERINQPEYDGVVWQKDEVVLLLKELLVV